MEEGCGNICRDFSGKNAPGTHSTALSRGIGNYPCTGCPVLDGQGGVACGTAASLSGLTPFSVSAWVKAPPNCEQAVIINQRGPTGYDGEYQLMVHRNGRPGFWIWSTQGSGGVCGYDLGNQFEPVAHNVIGTVDTDDRNCWVKILFANRSISDDQWHHVLALRHSKAGRIYIDGTLAASTIASHGVKALVAQHSVFTGYDGLDNNSCFEGSIGEVRIYNRALSENEIRSLHGYSQL